MILKNKEDWRYLSLREAGILLIDCDHRTPPPSVSGYPYVAIPQIKQGRIDLNDARLISHEHYLDWTKKAKPQPYDIVLSRRCNPGETGFVNPGLEFALGQNLVLLRSENTLINPQFLRWLVRGPEWWEQIEKFINVGAIFNSLRCADVPNFQLSIPPLPTQKAIAHILGTLDNKIELNRQMNDTLESIARAIFTSWFIDFDPVRAKAEGRQPEGMDAETAALFPSEFEEVEGQEIPKGWQVKQIGDIVEIKGGSTPSTENQSFWGGNIPFCTPKDLANNRIPFLLSTGRKITELGVNEISSGILPAETILLSSRAPIGYIAITTDPVSINQGFIALIPNDYCNNYYIYHWLYANMDAIIGNANGTTFLEISKKNFRPLPIILPSKEILKVYKSLINQLFEKIKVNLYQTETLTDLRDTLLPKLLSGELRIDTPEQFTGAS